MTCIVAIAYDDRVVMGADSAGVSGYDLQIRADHKIFINNKFMIGYTGSFRGGQLLQYSFTPPAKRAMHSLHQYMVTDFVDAIRSCFKDGGFLTQKDGIESCSFSCIIAHQNELYILEEDFQIGRSVQHYAAVGCGAPLALGAFYAGGDAQTALEAAEMWSAGVRRPFNTKALYM